MDECSVADDIGDRCDRLAGTLFGKEIGEPERLADLTWICDSAEARQKQFGHRFPEARVTSSFDDLPSEAALEAEARAMADELTAMRVAPVQDAEAAPAILDPEMSGVLFHEALGHKLTRQPWPNGAFGASQIIWKFPDGGPYLGASESRRDGAAVGF